MSLVVNFSTEQLVKDLKRSIAGLGIFITTCMVANCGTGCKLTNYADTEAAYVAEIRQCSLSAKTKADAKVCRQAVNRKYHLCDAPWPQLTPCDE